MLKEREELKPIAVIEDVICNRCGRSCRVEGEERTFVAVEIRLSWGYHSSKDEEWHRSHLCERCYDEIVASFAIPPEVRHYHACDPIDPFDNEIERWKQRWGWE